MTMLLERLNQELLELCTAQAQGTLPPSEFRLRRRELLNTLIGDSVTVPSAMVVRNPAAESPAQVPSRRGRLLAGATAAALLIAAALLAAAAWLLR